MWILKPCRTAPHRDITANSLSCPPSRSCIIFIPMPIKSSLIRLRCLLMDIKQNQVRHLPTDIEYNQVRHLPTNIKYNQVRLSSPPLSGRGAYQRISSKTKSNTHKFLKLPIIAFLNLWLPTPIPMPPFNSLYLICFFFFIWLHNEIQFLRARVGELNQTNQADRDRTCDRITSQPYQPILPSPTLPDLSICQSYLPRPPCQSRALVHSTLKDTVFNTTT